MLKGIGINLVVLGHTTCNVELGNWIYHFHMPLFFFLSGVFFFSYYSRVSKESKTNYDTLLDIRSAFFYLLAIC